MSSRFSTNEFQYNIRVSLALLPCVVILAGAGGGVYACIGMVGAMVVYILDALQYREAALLAVWLVLGLMNMCFGLTAVFFSDSNGIFIPVMTAIVNGITMFLVGVWATLQFKWVQLQYPVVVHAFEKLLLSCCLPVAATVQAWGVIAAMGLSVAPFYLAAILAVLYHLSALPLASSFAAGSHRSSIARQLAGGGKRSEYSVQGQLNGCVGVVLLVFLPSVMYGVTHAGLPAEWRHAWSLLLLLCLPILMVTTVQNGLWWLTGDRGQQPLGIRTLRFMALVGVLAGLEGRVLLPSFGHYLGLHYPWNVVAISAALVGAGALMLLHFEGVLSGELGSSLGGAALVLSCGAGGLACGLPLWLMPAPLVAASGIALFYDSGMVSYPLHAVPCLLSEHTWLIRDYCLFVGGALTTATWFLHHHYWFLNIQIQTHGLRFLCQLILAGLLPATLLPGIVMRPGSHTLVAPLMLGQACLIAYLEGQLHGGALDEGRQTYPAYLILLTSLIGLTLASKAQDGGLIGRPSFGVICSIYLAKFTLLILPQVELTAIAAVAIAVMAPALHSNKGKPPLPTSVYLLLTASSLAYARMVLYDELQLLLGYPPSAGVLTGALIIALALAQLPLVQQRYPHSQAAKRMVASVAAVGVLLVVFKPPLPDVGFATCPKLPFGLCPRLWDEAHKPEGNEDEAALYGSDSAGRSPAATWLLVAAAMLGLAGLVPSGGYSAGKPARTCGVVGLLGSAVGLYLGLELFPGQAIIQVILCSMTGFLAAAVAMIQVKGGSSGALGGLLMTWALSLPVALFLHAVLPMPNPQGPHPYGLHPNWDKERAQAGRAALLAVYAPQAFLLALAVKLKVSKASSLVPLPRHPSHLPRYPRADRAGGFLAACMPSSALTARQGWSGSALEGLGWLPTLGNLACLAWLALALCVSWSAKGAPDEAIFLLAPSLLLLSRDPLLFPGLRPSRRYSPCSVAVSSYLCMSALGSVVQRFWLQPVALAAAHQQTWLRVVMDLASLAAAMPNHFGFAKFLWSPSLARGRWLPLTTPLTIPAFFLSDPYATKLLAVIALVMAIVQFGMSRFTQQQGNKVI